MCTIFQCTNMSHNPQNKNCSLYSQDLSCPYIVPLPCVPISSPMLVTHLYTLPYHDDTCTSPPSTSYIQIYLLSSIYLRTKKAAQILKQFVILLFILLSRTICETKSQSYYQITQLDIWHAKIKSIVLTI